jgi:hypothetical protein
MLEAMLLAHLLGDYVFQNDALVRWKNRSLWGVAAHSAVVTLCLWICSLPFAPGWWPYALAIGLAHAVIDALRVQIDPSGPEAALALFLADQAAHGATVLIALIHSGWLPGRPAETALGLWLQASGRMPALIGYVLLSGPAWVWGHFLVRGMGAESTSLPGRPGERYVGMIERALIATLVLLGQYTLTPLVLVPRLALDGRGRAETERIGYLCEMLISVSLAVAVGVGLRAVG